MQTGLQQLTDVLKNDLGAVNVIAKGYATPTSVATGRR